MTQVITPPLLLGVGLALIYYLFGLTGFFVILSLFLGLLALIYFNQSKLLYMPGNFLCSCSCDEYAQITLSKPFKNEAS